MRHHTLQGFSHAPGVDRMVADAGLISTAFRGGAGGLGHSPQAPAMPIPIDGSAGDAANAGLLREKAC